MSTAFYPWMDSVVSEKFCIYQERHQPGIIQTLLILRHAVKEAAVDESSRGGGGNNEYLCLGLG